MTAAACPLPVDLLCSAPRSAPHNASLTAAVIAYSSLLPSLLTAAVITYSSLRSPQCSRQRLAHSCCHCLQLTAAVIAYSSQLPSLLTAHSCRHCIQLASGESLPSALRAELLEAVGLGGNSTSVRTSKTSPQPLTACLDCVGAGCARCAAQGWSLGSATGPSLGWSCPPASGKPW